MGDFDFVVRNKMTGELSALWRDDPVASFEMTQAVIEKSLRVCCITVRHKGTKSDYVLRVDCQDVTVAECLSATRTLIWRGGTLNARSEALVRAHAALANL